MRWCSKSTTVTHVKAIIQLFDDQSKAREILKTAEFYCDSTEDYIALAKGCAEVLYEPERIDDLMEEVAQIASKGEEFADLAYACTLGWNLRITGQWCLRFSDRLFPISLVERYCNLLLHKRLPSTQTPYLAI